MSFSFDDAPTIVCPPPQDAAPERGCHGTIMMHAIPDAPPRVDIRRELDEISLVVDMRALEAAGPRSAPARARVVGMPTVPPAPDPTPIVGIPIVSIGESACVEAAAPIPEEPRRQLDSLAPTSAPMPYFPVHAVELPARAANPGRWLQATAACAFFSVLLAVGVLRATGHIGPRAPFSSQTQAAATPPARVSPPAAQPTADPAAAPDDAAPPEQEEPAAEASPPPAQPTAPRPAAGAKVRGTARQIDHDIQVDSLFFRHTADERSVTLQLDGKSVILREGDVADDLQVQKILPDGVIFRRGKRLFAVYGKK